MREAVDSGLGEVVVRLCIVRVARGGLGPLLRVTPRDVLLVHLLHMHHSLLLGLLDPYVSLLDLGLELLLHGRHLDRLLLVLCLQLVVRVHELGVFIERGLHLELPPLECR